MKLGRNIKLLDLQEQNRSIQNDLDLAIKSVLNHTHFINGPEVNIFAENLKKYLAVDHVIPCGNGTDALQIALMALDLKEGDEVIIPAFTYAAVLEVIALLGLNPILVDVNENDFNIDVDKIEAFITSKTRAIVPVHLFGQACNMGIIMDIANRYNLFVIEDNAQSLGCNFKFKNGDTAKLGTIGHIGITSFFPTKNLGAFGDGGALMTNDEGLAQKIKMICNHGQSSKYHHDIIGVNSRLDSLQAAILNVKLAHLDNWAKTKNEIAKSYDEKLNGIEGIIVPKRVEYSDHVFHQYTIRVENNKRDVLREHLLKQGIETMVYYPMPLYRQKAYNHFFEPQYFMQNSETLCKEVLSLPIHTEMEEADIIYVVNCIKEFGL